MRGDLKGEQAIYFLEVSLDRLGEIETTTPERLQRLRTLEEELHLAVLRLSRTDSAKSERLR